MYTHLDYHKSILTGLPAILVCTAARVILSHSKSDDVTAHNKPYNTPVVRNQSSYKGLQDPTVFATPDTAHPLPHTHARMHPHTHTHARHSDLVSYHSSPSLLCITPASLLCLSHAKCTPASRPLHLQFPVPRFSSPAYIQGMAQSCISFTSSLLIPHLTGTPSISLHIHSTHYLT